MTTPGRSEPAAPAGRHRWRRIRLLKAYWVAARALVSYGWLGFAGRLLGPDWRAEREPQVHRRTAARLKWLILDLEGLFIKVGQLVSILSNFLPEEFREQLEELQDRVPPRPLAEIETRIRSELGASPGALFARFEAEPIASASLAQVHAARLDDGSRVAVKVQHLAIDRLARLDLKTIRRLLAIAGFFTRIRGLPTVFKEVEAVIDEELDFVREADNIDAIAANFADDPEVSFPRVYRDHSSRRVLVTELIDGIKISDLEALAARGLDRRRLAERLLNAYCRMVFTHGLFHADPHPGNILVRGDGCLVFIDFGAVARLTPEMRRGIPELLEAVVRRDTGRILHALRLLGFVAEGEREEVAMRIIDYFQSRFLEGLSVESWSLSDLQVDTRLKLETMADLRRLDISLRDLAGLVRVPKDWVLLERTLLLLLGLTTHLDPDMNPMSIARPYLVEHVLGRDRDWLALATSLLKETVASALGIPQGLARFLDQANRGELRVRSPDARRGAELLYALGQQLLFGLLGAASGAFAYYAHARGDVELARAAAVAGGLLLLGLLGALLSGRRLRRQGRR